MNDKMKNVYVVLHNVHAVSKVIETAQVVYGLGLPNYLVSKAEGSAAQTGVPEANRLAMKMKGSFAVL
ncbi:MAG: RecB-family nuclease, partial [Candidatus Thorarchaeota archaeon]